LGIIAHIKEYYRFLVHPEYKFKSDNPLTLSQILGLYFFSFILVILISGPLMTILMEEDMSHAMESIDEKMSTLQLFFMAVILMPILEEIFFRSHLGLAIWKKLDFGYPFYLTAGLFAIVHISNFSLDVSKWFYGPILVLPQLILGLFFGYVRVRNNLLASIFCHVLHNGLTMGAFLLAPDVQ